MPRKRTLKQYTNLYRNPKALFPPSADSAGVETILFPNGANEIWCQTPDGLGMRIVVSNGPHGLGINVRSFCGTPNVSDTDGRDSSDMELCQYRQTEKAQAYKRWYQHKETEADIQLLGETYRRKES